MATRFLSEMATTPSAAAMLQPNPPFPPSPSSTLGSMISSGVEVEKPAAESW